MLCSPQNPFFELDTAVPTADASVLSSDPLADLPDRPALEQLGRALWSGGTLRGAAVLVGSGVSRGGARLLSDDAPPPPLWSDLAHDMARELYGAQSANAPRDPLRLAEEFRAGLGDAALADFLRRRIRDDTFEPGPIHHDLLNLPWADVLTTNYDTLLERTAGNSRRGYDLVLAESELAHAGGPRIVKLHGSLRDGADVVISEEDYRTYPQRRAAFVNTARQVFIENELCLLGFSGDDPNFLQWAGWVRDRLGGHARRIYLVGALDLPPVKRHLLEARGVAPIDLAPAVKGEARGDRRHAIAISLFLSYLKAARPAEPADWKPASLQVYPSLHGHDNESWSRDVQDSAKVVEALRAALVIWRNDRQTCPGWLVSPRGVRLLIRHGTDCVVNLPLALASLPVNERRDALSELAWRHDCGGQPLPPWLAERMDAIVTAEMLAEVEPDLVLSLARTLLGAARAADNEEALETRATRFEALAGSGDLPALVAYERCLLARDRLNFAFVAKNTSKIEGDDPVWGLRRAALLYWIGEADEAVRTIGTAARDLRARVLRNPDSVALRSRLAWARMLAQALRWEDGGGLLSELSGLDRLALRDYDPWEQLRSLDTEVEEGLRKRLEERQIEPGFEAGTYRDNRNIITFGSATQVTPLSELRYLAERVGLPVRTSHVNILGTRLAGALRLAFAPTAVWHAVFLLTKPDYSKGPIDIHLGRIPVARLDEDAVAKLRKWLEHAIAFWRDRIHRRTRFVDDVSVLRLYIEALSRLTARDDPETAKAHARLAAELGGDSGLTHWWLDEPIGHLLTRAIDAVPPDERGELSPELLCFPLAAERGADDPSGHWCDPAPTAYRFVHRNGNEATFDARVATFLHHLAGNTPSRPEAAIRLLYLHEKGQLKSDQVASFADALWKDVPRDDYTLPEDSKLLPHAFLIAPAPPDIDARARVYAHLFGPDQEKDSANLVAAASGLTPYLQLNEVDALRLFGNVASWRPKEPSPDPISDAFARPLREEKDRMMALVLGAVAAPALARHDRTIERAEAVLTFLDETELPEGLSALPVFYGLNTDINRRIEDAFRRPLSVGDRRITSAAIGALDRWLRLSENGRALPLPNVLRDRALRALARGRIGGLAHLIYLARRLIEADLCDDPELDQIAEVLDELRAGTDYGSPDGDANVESDKAVSLPIIRAECVRLASVMEKTGRVTALVRAWRDLAACDPLPEVRYAEREVNDD